ncbi:hypothetical protein Ddye_009681 [Dipteronia dyeriana]|uniref:Uncharacterized protein n=1 Tax=Dipteronia dyeriana TaxID=168575 RepID=A0AAD9XBV0_9ROSI|nr:hypothetical protein Ddye_009681 [Dipteronia dyeriana]
MKRCISSSLISVLVNESPSKEFVVGRGLHQGDHLSSFLFNIVVEALNRLLLKARDLNLFRGLKINFHNSRVVKVGKGSCLVDRWAKMLRCKKGFKGEKRNIHLVEWTKLCRNGGIVVLEYGEFKTKAKLCSPDGFGGLAMRKGHCGEECCMISTWLSFGPLCGIGREGTMLLCLSDLIFALAVNKTGLVCEFGNWTGSVWGWHVATKRPILGWEETVWNSFLFELYNFMLRKSSPDSLIWSLTSSVVSNNKVWKVVFHAICWTIWEIRNDVVFKHGEVDSVKAMDTVRWRVACWFNYYGPGSSLAISILILDLKIGCVDANKKKRIVSFSWCPHLDGELKFNVDGSSRGNPERVQLVVRANWLRREGSGLVGSFAFSVFCFLAPLFSFFFVWAVLF